MLRNARWVLKTQVRRPQDSTGTPTAGRVNESLLAPRHSPVITNGVAGKTNTPRQKTEQTHSLNTGRPSNQHDACQAITWTGSSSTSTTVGCVISQRQHNNSNATIPRRPTTKTPALQTPGPCRPRSSTTSHQLMNTDHRRHTQLVAQTAHKHFDSSDTPTRGEITRRRPA